MQDMSPCLEEDNYDAPALAVVGFAFEFPPNASTSDSLWEMISKGRTASTDFPQDRMNIDAFYHPSQERPSTIPVRGGNFIREDLGAFDAPFFSITPGEAACMDPQHRRMLETTYRALEDAGIPIQKCSGSDTAVYTGCFTNDYINLLQQDFELDQTHAAMGIAPSMLANRISWFFNLKGTSMNLDSACSSSLIALHLAAQELHAGNCSMALVGGANLVYHPNFMKIMSAFNFLSPDSRSWSFDSRANGYARGEGLVMLVLKRVADALRDGDCIRAVIRNTGSNQDGRTPGITQPSLQSQLDLIKHTYRQAGISMTPTRFFEAHGPGTPVGDPIEANAIGQAFAGHCTREDPLYIGSIKANIGHLEGASGLAGLVKTIIVLEHGVIPPIAGFESLNPRIDAAKLCLEFPKEAVPWPSTGPRRACINSFGFGGTNATVILDDAYHYLEHNGLKGFHRTRPLPPIQTPSAPNESEDDLEMPRDVSVLRLPRLLVWSAADRSAAEKLGASYHEYVRQHPGDMADVAYTLAARRSKLTWRGFAVTGLDNLTPEITSQQPPLRSRDGARLAFVFTGQGAQYLGMGRELLAQPMFLEIVNLLDADLRSLGCPWSLKWLLETAESETPIHQPEYSQPATTCLQIALVDLLERLGVTPTLVLGHSSGEIAAAYTAGALSRSAAVKVAYYRGLLSSQLARQKTNLSMMAVGISQSKVQAYLDRLHQLEGTIEVEIGCVNSPNAITLTGLVDQLGTLQQWLEADGVFARRLRVPTAYHSSAIKAIAQDYRLAMGDLARRPESTSIPMISSVTEDVVTNTMLASADYWVRNLTSTVKFEGALSRLLLLTQNRKQSRKQLGRRLPVDLGIAHLLEIGPHKALQGPISETIRASPVSDKPLYMSLLERKQDAYLSLLRTAGQLFCAGHEVDILRVNGLEDIPRPMPSNLPPYPFNHQRSYWKEGRLSKNFRFPPVPRHDLLGRRSLDWNPQVAQWRNVVRLAELPWLRDHTIDGQIIFPGTGMVIMAVEALRQLPWAESDLTSIEIRDARFLHAIRFPEGSEQLETQLTLTTEWAKESTENPWSQFRLFTIEDDSYIECCRGLIRGSIDRELQARQLPFSSGTSFQDWVTALSSACQSSQDAYENPTGSSVQYGPCFQNLRNMRLGSGGKAIAHVDLSTWKTTGPSDEWTPRYTVHPVTMDGLAQLVVPALAHECDDLPTMVPVRAASIWINLEGPSMFNDGEILAAAQCSRRSNRGAKADVVGTSLDGSHLALYIEGLETTFISEASPGAGQGSELARNLCTSLIWKADIDMLSGEQLLQEVCRGRPSEPRGALERHESLQLAIVGFLDEAIRYTDQHPDLSIPFYLRRYVDWMQYQRDRLYDSLLATANGSILRDPSARNQLVLDIEKTGIEGYFFMHVGRNLIAILSGDTDPLDVMFRNGLADRYYEQMLANEHHAYPISRYLDLQCFKNPSLKILEVGAGTGGQTLCALQSLCSEGVQKCAQYDYTDISPAFFPQARENFQDFLDIMRFQTCDISRDPVSQSFEQGSYDLVLASHVLHATDRLDVSLQNIKKLLKPGGKLLLVETTDPDALQIPFAFGLLKGWWSPLSHEARSDYSPCLTLSQWDECLKRNGFSGIEIEIPGQEFPACQYSSIIISSATAEDNEVPVSTEDLVVVRDPTRAYQCDVAATLTADQHARICTLDEAAQLSIKPVTLIVVLLEMEAILLAGLHATTYTLLQRVMTQAKNVLWVTRPLVEGERLPQHSLVEGFGRTLASEDSARKFVTLALHGHETADQATRTILKLTSQMIRQPVDMMETTFATSDGVLKIPRVSQNEHMNKIIHQYNRDRGDEQWDLNKELGSIHRAATLVTGARGRPDAVEYREKDEALSSMIADDEVVIQVQAFGLTPRDYLVASGQLEQGDLGTQCSGIIHQAAARSGFKPGDRVCAIGTAMAGTLIRTKASAVVAIPSDLSFTDAAALPTPLWLAFSTLDHFAKLTADDNTVLITEACTNIGQMAVQLATNRGVRVLATATSEAQKAFLCANLGLPECDVFLSNDHLLASKLKQITEGKGVDVIVGSCNAEANPTLNQCLAPCGSMVDISWGPVGHSQRARQMLTPNTSYTLLDMVDLHNRKPRSAHGVFQRAMEWFFEGQSKPPQSVHVYQAGKEQEALQQYQEANMIGEPVIVFENAMPLLVNCSSKSRYLFPENASYVIAGGLGGLGRSFARWMASRGARHLILLSRSGPSTSTTQAFVKELEDLGVQVVTPKVDISDISHLEQDNLYDNMTYEDWSISTDSKVTGSWNLHRALPKDLDFFILLSSLNGIFGSRAQANYAAGNTFKDALAHHRLAQKQKAVSIDLGLMVAEGVVAESEFLLSAMRRIGHLMEIAQDELLALLDYYCNPALPLLSATEAQVIVGIELPADVTAKGIDLHHSIRRPLFSHLFRMGSRTTIGGAAAAAAAGPSLVLDHPAILRTLSSVEEATEQIVQWVTAKVGHILGLSAADIDPGKPVHTYGIDSLVAVDLKNWFDREIGASITVFDLMGNTPLRRLGEMAAEKSRYRV
ncbi:hypothetical protein BP00DRAFT_460764 [Aspergillus indologenus CBS 114.80]|uniref:Uncharacterized protein n=1 Tax=Aspergillus indologenus CBS 114.80 TaxID=1450541 RepID=A0A2V5HQL2_9EURO|nr:hypothetical protein BP00DRAFT_460764 [Aspergillus indologenus CBS 114.80]